MNNPNYLTQKSSFLNDIHLLFCDFFIFLHSNSVAYIQLYKIYNMKKYILLLFVAMNLMPIAAKKQPAIVILTAGQSNTDGRVDNSELPKEILQQKYKCCQWSFGSSYMSGAGKFDTFWPRILNEKNPNRWTYDAIVYWNIEKKIKKNFYVIKESLGGTAIDTLCESNSNQYWNASPEYLSKNKASDKGGKSLLKAFTENIGACIDNKLSKIPEGYDIKFMLWHQGESDRHQAQNYYQNLKQVITYIRTYLAEKTSNPKYKNLPIIIGSIPHKSRQWSQGVEDAQHRLAQEDKNIYVVDVPNASLGKDVLHFDAIGAQELGNKMYQVIEKHQLLK